MTLLISCGEPAGIGPEVAAKAWAALKDEVSLAFIGDPRHLPHGTPVVEIAHPAEAPHHAPHALPVLARDFGAPAVAGQPDPRHAQGVIDAIRDSVDYCMKGEAAGLVTAPINKKALADGAGFTFPGHTEYLAHLAGDVPVVMMLACPELRVVPTTIHIAVADVPKALTRELLSDTIRITAAGLQRDFGIENPRIAIAGLNPHAGEGGKMGTEEITLITPLLNDLRTEGYSLSGPLPPDTMFHAAARARYDAAICMYHDQALIPIKTIDFAGGVNVTLGLPFLRTSPDHGTAFDIAGQGIADATSMIAAIRMAAQMSRMRKI